MSAVEITAVRQRSAMEAAEGVVRRELRARLDADGSWGAKLQLEGQLIRPLIAYAGLLGADHAVPAEAFWRAALAVQLAHEASLVHDDVIDGATTRRGTASVAARRGAAAALVAGDHLLTSAYRHAAATGSIEFADRFARAVERTVAGEIEQADSAGAAISTADYRRIVSHKSGELLGAALSASAAVVGAVRADQLAALGRRMGLLYQMTDDLLDYCVSAPTGKEPFADHRQRKWTWVLDELPGDPFALDVDSLRKTLLAGDARRSPLRRCLERLAREVAELTTSIASLFPRDVLLRAVVSDWYARAESAVEREEAVATNISKRAPARRAPSAALRAIVPTNDQLDGYLARHSRSFHLSSRFFPRPQRAWIARLYAFCRVTDDIGDGHPELDPGCREALLDEWLELARASYHGVPSGLAGLDDLMRESAHRGVPFDYPAELVEGIRMDLRGQRYPTFEDLEVYTYRVASVVGLWLTESALRRDPATLNAAAALGRAMQLTNIARDVGEDLRAGRLYLPVSCLDRHGLTEASLREMESGAVPITASYAALTEELLRRAEREYKAAMPYISRLPASFRTPVGIAAHVYRGIHASIRDNGYDNLRRRAYTTPVRKLGYTARAVWEVWLRPDEGGWASLASGVR